MNLAGELKRLRLARGLTQADVADLAEVSQPSVNAYEAGRKRPGIAVCRRLALALGLPADALLRHLPEVNFAPLSLPPVVPAGAGPGVESLDADPDGGLDLNAIFGRPGLRRVRVRGDSMAGERIFDGDEVVVRVDPEPRHGEVVLVEVDGGLVLKTLRRNGDRWVLYSRLEGGERRKFREIDPTKQDVRIVGVVFYLLRKL